ncbi:L-seryl-tRNA(Sec) selenium transferase [Limnoglobus roseus]|uniref:L-seryl-tRNA(Sec) selenium transferase n=1 Tax=Limnoglobus roseus TaxID=2598579 RepID=A0A5C1AMJ4_9BACT|nr:L-seryl-tRNA(Sec) selenium transferase [Limnoglobus roseus]QEL18952.1 L-seryl-tRNA(Sec) selenium transferase [Limnoglobus roseus]
MSNPYRVLPAVSQVLEHPELVDARGHIPHDELLTAVCSELDRLRSQIAAGESVEEAELLSQLVRQVSVQLEKNSLPLLQPVINATGIVLHTNLGRSPMCEDAAQAAYEAARGYLNLELDLATGKRSSRQNPVRDGICRLTGAEAATVVNNCAAATILVLRTLAMGKEVVVSRGQLIEIGGSFRIPDILAVSGATLREVGTTNITRARDYENAVGPNTGAILRVHASNYRVSGFTKSVGIEELVTIGRKHNVPVIDDIGSGAAVDLSGLGFTGEPDVREGIRAGADVVLFSGDKLLGGPQAGIIAGRKALIDKMEADPLMRALRLDKMTLAALEVTLRMHRDPARAAAELPIYSMMLAPLAELRTRAERFAERLRAIPSFARVEVLDDIAYVGGGSLPDQALPTTVVAMAAVEVSDAEFARRLRVGQPAVVCRVRNGTVRIDLRTVFERQEDDLLHAIIRACG